MDEKIKLKKMAGEAAVKQFVKSDMVVGLGTGSTAIFATRKIGEMLQSGELRRVWGIPTSRRTAEQAKVLGVPLTTLAQHPVIDVTIDGADEINPQFNIIKGGGGALLREKIVAQASKQLVIVGDESKVVPVLGTRWAIPIEVISFGGRTQVDYLESLGARVTVRRSDDGIFHTDSGNLILDAQFGEIPYVYSLAEKLERRVGIVEHGLFLDLVTNVLIAAADGVRQLERQM